MRRASIAAFALFIIGLICLAQQPRAQLTMTAVGGGFGGAVAYSGPGNIVSGAIGWWGLRGYTAAFSGNVVNVCDAATGLVCGDATWSAGGLSFPLIGGVACNNVTNICVVGTLYDQSGAGACSGACDAKQTNNSNRPVLTLNCIGSLPCLTGTASTSLLTPALVSTYNQPNWFSAVGKRTGNPGASSAMIGTDVVCYFGATATDIVAYAGSVLTATSTDNTWHSVQCTFNGGSSEVYVDGSGTSGNAGSTAVSSTINIMNDVFGNKLSGTFVEAGFWNLAPNSGQKSSINSNQHTYWGF